jgi:hypothetical protein
VRPRFCALLLCTDLKPAQIEPLLLNFIQVGIDLGGMVGAGHPGWTGWGGHGSGRKLPIVFAGLLLGDDELAHINQSFPTVSFGEDGQTLYGGGELSQALYNFLTIGGYSQHESAVPSRDASAAFLIPGFMQKTQVRR